MDIINPEANEVGRSGPYIHLRDRETVLEIIGPGDQSGEDEFPYTTLQLRPS